MQNTLYVQVLRSPILAVLLHGTPTAGISQTLRCGTGNGIIELSQRAPPIYGWMAIMLGIGPHSSYLLFILIYFFRFNLRGRRTFARMSVCGVIL